MRYILLCLTLALGLFAGAANAAPACWPAAFGGTGQGSVTVPVPGVGTGFGTWCPTKYDWKSEVFGIADGYTLIHPPGAMLSPGPVAALAYWDANAKTGCSTVEAQCKAAALALAATKPPIPKWTVAANGTALDRPTYSVVAGADGAPAWTLLTGIRAPVGATCRCELAAIMKATQTMCPYVDEAKSALTACARAN